MSKHPTFQSESPPTPRQIHTIDKRFPTTQICNDRTLDGSKFRRCPPPLREDPVRILQRILPGEVGGTPKFATEYPHPDSTAQSTIPSGAGQS